MKILTYKITNDPKRKVMYGFQLQEVSTMVNLKMGNHMDTASMNQNLVNSILVNGKMEINMEKELNSLNKELTLANGSATKSKG